MQICLSLQSLSPSHHFLHSNAFSHLNKFPPFSRSLAVDVLVLSTHTSLFLHVWPPCPMWRCRGEIRWFACAALHLLLPGVSGDNKKWTRQQIIFFFVCLVSLRWITLPLCFQQEAGSVGRMGKVNGFFFLPLSSAASYASIPIQSSQDPAAHERSQVAGLTPLPSLALRVASSPGPDALH